MDIESSFDMSIPVQMYTGKSVTPMPIVSRDGKVLMDGASVGTADSQYLNITYENNIEFGNATAIVEGWGKFRGQVRVPFQIIDESDFGVESLVGKAAI